MLFPNKVAFTCSRNFVMDISLGASLAYHISKSCPAWSTIIRTKYTLRNILRAVSVCFSIPLVASSLISTSPGIFSLLWTDFLAYHQNQSKMAAFIIGTHNVPPWFSTDYQSVHSLNGLTPKFMRETI